MTQRYGIDTSVLVRLLTGSPRQEYERCHRLLTGMIEEQRRDIFASNQVIGESLRCNAASLRRIESRCLCGLDDCFDIGPRGAAERTASTCGPAGEHRRRPDRPLDRGRLFQDRVRNADPGQKNGGVAGSETAVRSIARAGKGPVWLDVPFKASARAITQANIVARPPLLLGILFRGCPSNG